MTVDQILQQEIKDTEVYLTREKEESVYKRDIIKNFIKKECLNDKILGNSIVIILIKSLKYLSRNDWNDVHWPANQSC